MDGVEPFFELLFMDHTMLHDKGTRSLFKLEYQRMFQLILCGEGSSGRSLLQNQCKTTTIV
jgi:hypothetical protein